MCCSDCGSRSEGHTVLAGLQSELGGQRAELLTAEELASVTHAAPYCVRRRFLAPSGVRCQQFPDYWLIVRLEGLRCGPSELLVLVQQRFLCFD